MVNTGKPSRGCLLCRKRKIKCDEGKPACRNCNKYGRVCPGWPEAGSLNRTMSNDVQESCNSSPDPELAPAARTNSCPATKRTKYSTTPELEQKKRLAHQAVREQRPQMSRPSSLNSSPMIKGSPLSSAKKPLSSFPEAQDRLEDKAVSLLFESGIMSTMSSAIQDINPIDMICELCRESGPLSPLNRALNAAALANLCNRYPGTDLRMQAQYEYGQAIGGLKLLLRDPNSCLQDSTLATLLVLRMCEILLTFNPKPYTTAESHQPLEGWQGHVEGMHALLRMRGADRFSTPRERWLFEVCWRAVRARNLNNCQGTDDTLFRFERELEQMQAGRHYPLSSCYSYYITSVAKLRAEIRGLIDRGLKDPQFDGFEEGLATLQQAAEGLDSGVGEWLQQNDQWLPHPMPPEVVIDVPNGRVLARQFFCDPVVFLFRRRISFARIKLHESLIAAHSAMLELMERAQSQTSTARATSSSFAAVDKVIMHHVAFIRGEFSGLLGWIAYGLGDVDEQGRLASALKLMDGAFESLRFDDGFKLGLRTVGIYEHLAAMIQSEYLTEPQIQAANTVLRRIVDWFQMRQDG